MAYTEPFNRVDRKCFPRHSLPARYSLHFLSTKGNISNRFDKCLDVTIRGLYE